MVQIAFICDTAMGTVPPAAAEVVNDARDDKISPTSADRVARGAHVRDECEPTTMRFLAG